MSMKQYDISIRIPYADVDQMGVVYYANYLVYFERGRTEFLRALGADYKRIETEDGLFLPVNEVTIKYRSPARYDDDILVRTYVEGISKATVLFSYDIFNASDNILVSGTSRHVFINAQWKPKRPPDWLKKLILPCLRGA